MTDDEIAKVEGGVVLMPMTAGEIVLAYNLPGNPAGLKLPRDSIPTFSSARSPAGTIRNRRGEPES